LKSGDRERDEQTLDQRPAVAPEPEQILADQRIGEGAAAYSEGSFLASDTPFIVLTK